MITFAYYNTRTYSTYNTYDTISYATLTILVLPLLTVLYANSCFLRLVFTSVGVGVVVGVIRALMT